MRSFYTLDLLPSARTRICGIPVGTEQATQTTTKHTSDPTFVDNRSTDGRAEAGFAFRVLVVCYNHSGASPLAPQ